jgi:DNA-binding LytR/AlgR family response regulator
MKCIIIDDDDASRTVLKQLVGQVSYLNLVAVCTKPSEAVSLLKKEQVDLAFLDIEMPEMTGMELLGSVAMPPTILTTTHKEYALDAFEHNIIDYLVKPVTLPRFIKAVEKAKAAHNKVNAQDGLMERDYFFIKKDSVHTKVPTKDILWIEALGDYITINTVNGKYILHLTLKSIEGKLSPDKFIRVHRSYIVNIDNVGMVEDTTIFINNVSIPVGALYKESFLKVLNLL